MRNPDRFANSVFQTVVASLGVAVLLSAELCGQTTAPAPPPTTTTGGINERFLDPELDPQEFVDRFERESREVYTARQAILQVTQVSPGECVADVGAGTGLFTVLFSSEVGDDGWVYAVDISPRFIEHITARSQEAGLENVTPVLCDEDSINLPPASVDLVFVCDTYHHFEFHEGTLASIRRALRPDGRLVVIDFIREEGISSDWILGHVRAGKDVFASEIETAGFRLENEPTVKGLEENYVLVFRKAPQSGQLQ